MLSDQQFLQQFESLELAPELFNHQGHIRLAMLYLQKYELSEAIRQTADRIRTYACSLGAGHKFHLTMTVAAVVLLWQKQPLNDFPSLLRQYYSDSLLASELARHHWCPPDVQPLPQMEQLDVFDWSVS